jgi:uncharacterized integral membrane protein
MRIISLIFVLILATFAISFAALNSKSVEVNYLLGTTTLPLVVLLLFALMMGVLICVFVISLKVYSLRKKNRKLEKSLKQKQHELAEMQKEN